MSVSAIAQLTFPWDRIEKYKSVCDINLSVGSPVDDVPQIIQDALRLASNAYSYPTTAGTNELKEAICGWFERIRGVKLDANSVIPTIGSKEAVALTALMLGVGQQHSLFRDIIVQPAIAYPTYEIGALAANAQVIRTDNVDEWRTNPHVKIVWLCSPNNPTGQVKTVTELQEVATAAREIGAVVIADECYATLDWRTDADTSATPNSPASTNGVSPCLLSDDVCGGDLTNLLVLYSLSKRSNMAGYRTGIVAGDPALVSQLLAIRKQFGLMIPSPIQAAMTVAFSDDTHAERQTSIYRNRRNILLNALQSAGYQIIHSDGGLYLWTNTLTEDCWSDLEMLSKIGILPAPGEFYSSNTKQNLRWSITATDEQIAEASKRLSTLSRK